MLTKLGPRWAYVGGLGVFGVGSVLCAVAPSMEFLLLGRVVQGAAGGLLAGLGYAVINSALPQSLWTKASALVSAMWGVGTLVGPAAGGLFAQFGSWRWAFGLLALLTAAMAALVPFALPGRTAGADRPAADRIPVWSLLLLGAAALGDQRRGHPAQRRGDRAASSSLGVVLVAVFLVVDRRTSASVLPPMAFRPGPLKWIYLTLGVLMAATMADMYVPLFGQRLATWCRWPLASSASRWPSGWTISEIISASLTRTRSSCGGRGSAAGDGRRPGHRRGEPVRGRARPCGRGVGGRADDDRHGHRAIR